MTVALIGIFLGGMAIGFATYDQFMTRECLALAKRNEILRQMVQDMQEDALFAPWDEQ